MVEEKLKKEAIGISIEIVGAIWLMSEQLGWIPHIVSLIVSIFLVFGGLLLALMVFEEKIWSR